MNIYDFILEEITKNNQSLTDLLIKRFKSSKKILEVSNDDIAQTLYKSKLGEDTIRRFLEKREEFNRDKSSFIGRCNLKIRKIREEFNIEIISFSDPDYPTQLKEIKGIPLNLYVKGDFKFDFFKSIAIVGTRNATSYAKEKVAEISKQLSREGFCIISGLARGVDERAHSSTLAVRGKTIAILPFFSDMVYPPEHEQLAKEILENGGALISERFFPNKIYERSLFTDRNRIISGLSNLVLIVEGSKKSGSLSQYNHAKRQKKIILTLKPIKEHEGTFLPKMIKERGGFEIESAEDIIKILREKTHRYSEKRMDSYFL